MKALFLLCLLVSTSAHADVVGSVAQALASGMKGEASSSDDNDSDDD